MKITQSSNGRTRAFEVLNSGSTPLCVTKKRVVTKVISTGALEASVSRFDSCLLDKRSIGEMAYHPILSRWSRRIVTVIDRTK